VTGRKIALFLSCPAFEDFYGEIGVTRETYVASYQNDWSFDYVRMWQGLGNTVVVYHFSRELRRPEVRTHKPTGSTIKFLPMPALDRLQGLVRDRHLVTGYLSSLSLALWLDLHRERPDFIYVQEYEWGRFDVLTLYGRALRIPVIAHHHGAEGTGGSRGAFLRGWAIRGASKLLCVNHAEYRRATSRYPGLDEGKLEIVHNPVDSDQFFPMDKTQAKADLGLSTSQRYLLFVGRLHPHKGLPYLLEAFARVQPQFPDASLILIGTGPLENELHEWVRRQELQNVRFEGWVSSKDRLRTYHAASEFSVVSSLRESFCIAAAEAMACGRPVLGTKVDGLLEQVVDGENGFLVAPADSAALAAQMARMLGSPELCQSMGQRARHVVEQHFSDRAVSAQMARILSEVGETR
jgi:glycosyltransferase involved in cell wall biosynthesis